MSSEIKKNESIAKEIVKNEFFQNSEQWESLLIYLDLLVKHTSISQLVSRADLKIIWQRHVLDCAQLAKYFRISDKTVIDLGSGNGFPGIILATMFPNMKFKLCDSNQGKCDFLKIVSRETSCVNVEIINYRVESFENEANKKTLRKSGLANSDIVITRAFGTIQKCFDCCNRVIKKDGQMLLQRGQNWQEEWRDYKLAEITKSSKTIKYVSKPFSKSLHWSYGKSITSKESVILVASAFSQADYNKDLILLS